MELKKHGIIKAPITVEPLYGVSEKFKGIESFTRSTSMSFQPQVKLPEKIVITTEESSHVIFTQVGRQKCFICQETKHKSSDCPKKIKRTENILNDSFHFPSIGAANNTETGDKAGSTKNENEANMDESEGFKSTGAKDIPVVHKAAVARTPHKKLRLSANSSVIRSDWLYNEWKDITQGLLKPSLNADLNSFLGRIPRSDL